MEIAKGFKNTDYKNLDLSDPKSADWQKAINIFIKRMEPRYLEPIRMLIAEDSKLPVRERRFGFTITAIMCLLIETLYCFRNGITDNTGKARKTFVDFLTKSNHFAPHFDTATANLFYDHFRNGILHQAETKDMSRIHDIGPLIRKVGTGIVINRTEFFKLLEEEFHLYIDELSDSANIGLRQSFKTKMDHICK